MQDHSQKWSLNISEPLSCYLHSSNSLDSVQAGQGMLSKLNYAGMPLSSSAVSTALLRSERFFFWVFFHISGSVKNRQTIANIGVSDDQTQVSISKFLSLFAQLFLTHSLVLPLQASSQLPASLCKSFISECFWNLVKPSHFSILPTHWNILVL